MNDNKIFDKLKDQMIALNEKEVLQLCQEAIDLDISPNRIVEELGKAMDIIGEKYEDNEVFLSGLIMSGEIMKGAMKIIEPHLKSSSERSIGRVIIGTVEGDVHDIGKNLVIMLLQSAGFEVHDLGTDVAVTNFIKAVEELHPTIIAMSSLLTTTMQKMKDVITELKVKGLRDNVRIIIGGAPINKNFGKEIGADAAALDAVEGTKICKAWTIVHT